MFRPLQGVDNSISIGRIERRYKSLQTYDTNKTGRGVLMLALKRADVDSEWKQE